MNKLILIMLSLFVFGCGDNSNDWEANFILSEYSPDALMSTESKLYSNGYKRVKFYYSRHRGVYIFHATRKEDKNDID